MPQVSYNMLDNAKGLNLNWQALPQFPVQGVAGSFVGFLDDTLIVVGGVNFPCFRGNQASGEELQRLAY